VLNIIDRTPLVPYAVGFGYRPTTGEAGSALTGSSVLNSGGSLSKTSAAVLGTTGTSVLAVCVKRTGSPQLGALISAGTTTAKVALNYVWTDGVCYADFGGSAGANRISYTPSNLGEVKRIVFAAGSGGSRLVENGALKASQGSSVSRTDAADIVYIGRNTANCDTLTDIFLTAVWNRELTLSECLSLSTNPWQLFAPRRLVIPTSSAGTILPTLTSPSMFQLTSTTGYPRVTAS